MKLSLPNKIIIVFEPIVTHHKYTYGGEQYEYNDYEVNLEEIKKAIEAFKMLGKNVVRICSAYDRLENNFDTEYYHDSFTESQIDTVYTEITKEGAEILVEDDGLYFPASVGKVKLSSDLYNGYEYEKHELSLIFWLND